MTIKELAYSAQQHLQASTGSSLKRAHIYELLAASFGFNSYAAFGVDTVSRTATPERQAQAVPASAISSSGAASSLDIRLNRGSGLGARVLPDRAPDRRRADFGVDQPCEGIGPA
jgi:hypothetical protein